MNVTNLMVDGFVRVPYPTALRQSVAEAVESWKAFTTLPPEEKKKLSLGDRHKDIGYVRREDKGHKTYDDKEFFHASIGMPQELHEIAAKFPDRRATAFLDATDTLINKITPLIEEFASSVELRWELYRFARQVMENRANWKFRYLHYFPSQSGAPIAHAHADRGGFTLHMYESHPGAEYLNFKGEWRPLPVKQDETVIFPSMMLQHRSKSKLVALCHQVLATPEAAQEGRYSMVAFIDFTSDHRFNDQEFRLQDLPKGFNYGRSEQEMQKYFVLRT
jgi:isopenicillin N synthase-like dioxygenase